MGNADVEYRAPPLRPDPQPRRSNAYGGQRMTASVADTQVIKAARRRLRHVLRRVYLLDTRVQTGATALVGTGIGAAFGSVIALPFTGAAVGGVVGLGVGRAINHAPFKQGANAFFQHSPVAITMNEAELEAFVRDHQGIVRRCFGSMFWLTLLPVSHSTITSSTRRITAPASKNPTPWINHSAEVFGRNQAEPTGPMPVPTGRPPDACPFATSTQLCHRTESTPKVMGARAMPALSPGLDALFLMPPAVQQDDSLDDFLCPHF